MISIARMAVIGAAAMLAFAAIGTIASIGGITTTAFAQVCTNDMQACNKGSPREEPGKPNIPSCWGQVSSGFAQTGQMGQHVSNPIPSDEDPDSPRLGLGNTLEDGPQGHGEVVGPRFGQTCE
jgi:hypothetical protein